MVDEGVFPIEGSIGLREIDSEISFSVTTVDPKLNRVAIEYSTGDPADVIAELESVSGITNAEYVGEAPQ